jgi:hypothetical protein
MGGSVLLITECVSDSGYNYLFSARQNNALPSSFLSTSIKMRSLAVIFLTLVSAVLGQLDSLDYCYGEVSICAEANDLAAPCDQLVDETQDTKYWQCLCGSGYVSTNEA